MGEEGQCFCHFLINKLVKLLNEDCGETLPMISQKEPAERWDYASGAFMGGGGNEAGHRQNNGNTKQI